MADIHNQVKIMTVQSLFFQQGLGHIMQKFQMLLDQPGAFFIGVIHKTFNFFIDLLGGRFTEIPVLGDFTA